MKPKLLIVDDDPDMRRVLRGILEPLGQILDAANGSDALRLLKDEKPALMLLDVSMPEMGGLAVLQSARRLAPKLAVLMLTGELDLETARRALDAGARAYVTKPFDPEALRAEVSRQLGAADGTQKKRPDRPWRVRL